MTQRFLNYSSSKGTLRVVQQNKDVHSHFQAILPIRGKSVNVGKSSLLDKILANEEIRSLFTAMGTGLVEIRIYRKLVTAKISHHDRCRCRWKSHPHIAHYSFYRYMRPAVEAGYIYIAQPPPLQVETR